jgi:hypothetical protein
MGRRKGRKRSRRIDQRTTRQYAPRLAEPYADEETVERLLSGFWDQRLLQTEESTTCGQCREFVEDGDFGRGTCLHPASGVLSPWGDTPACPYFARVRRGY